MKARQHNYVRWLQLFLLTIFAASVTDILYDLKQGSSWIHLAQESLLAIAAMALFVWLVTDLKREQLRNQQLESDLQSLNDRQAQLKAKLRKAQRNFADLVRAQLEQWQLTPSEQEIAWLLLKGYNSKEISAFRGTAEKTVRNQLTSIYRKSELRDKQAFISWFVDDLFTTPTTDELPESDPVD